jgi:aromatic ring-opening dioxygenase LigB subunit
MVAGCDKLHKVQKKGENTKKKKSLLRKNAAILPFCTLNYGSIIPIYFLPKRPVKTSLQFKETKSSLGNNSAVCHSVPKLNCGCIL